MATAAAKKNGHWSGGGMPYATASTVSELIADINYANTVGGVITINLAPGATFDLTSAHNATTTYGANGLPVIGGTKAVALTITGNGATIRRTAGGFFRLFLVAPGASLTLGQVTLTGGRGDSGGAILNRGTLNLINSTLSGNNSRYNGGGISNFVGAVATISNDSILTGNYGMEGGAISNGGTVAISDSSLSGNSAHYGGGIFNLNGTVSATTSAFSRNLAIRGGGIYNSGGTSGTVTISDSTVSDNGTHHADYPWREGAGGGIYNASGTLTLSRSILTGNVADVYFVGFGSGGGIYNLGTVAVEDFSSITGNHAYGPGADVNNLGELYLDSTSTIWILDGNSAIPF